MKYEIRIKSATAGDRCATVDAVNKMDADAQAKKMLVNGRIESVTLVREPKEEAKPKEEPKPKSIRKRASRRKR